MSHRQKNDGYNNQYKKSMDKSKYKTRLCDKGYKCPYRRVDQDGTLIKIYCTFIHYPYDLCPDKQECEFFQTEDCIWKHNTKPKPKPKPKPVAQLKPPVLNIIKDDDLFPAIGAQPIDKSLTKSTNKTTNAINQPTQTQANTKSTPSQANKIIINNVKSINSNISISTLNSNNTPLSNHVNGHFSSSNNNHNINPTLNTPNSQNHSQNSHNHSQNSQNHSQNSQNHSQNTIKNDKHPSNNAKQPSNSTNNPESNSYLRVHHIMPQKSSQTKSETYHKPHQPLPKIQQKPQQHSQNSYKSYNPHISTHQIPIVGIQKSSLQFNAPYFISNQQMNSLSHQSQLQRLQATNRQTSQIQSYSRSDYAMQNIQQQRHTQITKDIQKLANQILKYNITKNELDQEDYENNIKLTQILKFSNDLRRIAKSSLSPQTQITYQTMPNDNQQINFKNNQAEIRNEQQSQNYQQSHQVANRPNQQIKPDPKSQIPEPPKQTQPTSRINSNGQAQATNTQAKPTNVNQQTKPEDKTDNDAANKRVILSLEQISQLSVDTKNTALSRFLLTVFLDFITDKDHIEFRFQVHKRKFQIYQKFYGQDHKKDNKHQRYSPYSIEVLEQSHFEQLCQTITKYSYHTKKNQKIQNNQMNLNAYSLINSQDASQNQTGPENVIKNFFLHLFQYFQFYFQQIRKDFKDKTLDVLDIFYKFVILSEEILPANTPQVTIQDPNHFKGPIYVGGLRAVCMRFFARIFLLFLENNLYAIMKLKQEMKNSKSPSFDSKTITKYMQEKQQQTVKKLTGNLYKDNIECNKKKRPMDRQLIDSQVKDKLASEVISRSHNLIDQIMLGQKDTLLTWQSMKEYIELKAHEQIFTDYIPETEIEEGKIEMIKIICKGQIWIEDSDRKKYNQKEKNRFSFLESYFMEKAVGQEIKQEHNEFIANKTLQIGQKSYASLLPDGKYIIEEPFEKHRIQQHQNGISTKLKQKNSKNNNPPYHQTKISYYAKGKTGVMTCPLESIAQDSFFKNKILDFTQDSPYLVYCNQQNGFYGPESINSLKIRIYRQGGIIEFINAKSLQQCKRFFSYILEILKSPKESSENYKQVPSYFFLTTKPDTKALMSTNDKDQMSRCFSMQTKEKRPLRYKKQSLSIITWNLKRVFESDLIHRQISKSLRCKNIIKDLKTLKPDIICLQEVKDFKKQLYQQLCEQNQLYFMPFYEDVGDYQTLILTRFPVKYSTVKIATQKWGCCEFQIQTYTEQNQAPKIKKITESEDEKQRQQIEKKETKNLQVLIMSVHLKCTEMDSEDNFLASTLTRQRQLKKMQQFFEMNEAESSKKYDLIIMAGDFNIDDEPVAFKQDGETVHQCDHNGKYLKYPPYFDLQAELHPETLETCKTYLHKGMTENGKYRLGGTRIDRILVRAHSSIDIDDVITSLKDFSLVGNYSLRSKQNANEVNYDKFTRSPSDHFGVYMEIPFNL